MRGPKPQQAARSVSYKAVVMGGSAGGFEAFADILSVLPGDFVLPVLLVQHLHPSDDGSFARHLASTTRLHVVEPCDKERVERGWVYTARRSDGTHAIYL